MKTDQQDDQDDIRADIEAAMQSAETGAPGADDAAAPQAAKATDATGEAGDELPPEGRVRDETGKFAKAPEPAQATDTQLAPVAEPPQETIRPPASWSATAKADFAQLPPHIQQEVLKREKDIETGKAQWDAKGEKLNKFEALIAPRREKLALAGVDEFTAIQQLLAAQDFLERDPQAALAHLAQLYGASLPTGQFPQPQGQPQVQETPAVAELRNQVLSLSQALAQRDQVEEQAKQQAAVAEWMAFQQDPAHPYAENVKEEMVALLQQGRAKTLSEAYEGAVWANPETRALMQRVAPANEPAKDTRKAGLGITGAPGLGQQPADQADPNASPEDDVRAAYRQVVGRV